MSTTLLILQCFALFPVAGNAVRQEEALAQIAVTQHKAMFEPNRTALELAFSTDPTYHVTDLRLGQTFKLLGKGAFGAVFQCEYKIGKGYWDLVVKQISDDEQAKREKAALQILHGCPFVTQYVNSKITAAYHYMVLWPMARGYDNQIDMSGLLLARNGDDDRFWELFMNGNQEQLKGLEPQELKFALAQFAMALHSMHVNGLSHNDIHAGQLILDGVLSPEHANVPKVLLTDFGLASLSSNDTNSANHKFFSDWAFFGDTALTMCNGFGVTCATQYAFCTRDNENVDKNACEEFRCSRDDLLSCPNTDLADLLLNWCLSGPISSQAMDATSDFSNQFWSHPFWQGVDWQRLKVIGSPPSEI